MILAVTKRDELWKEPHIVFILWNCLFSSRTDSFTGGGSSSTNIIQHKNNTHGLKQVQTLRILKILSLW